MLSTLLGWRPSGVRGESQVCPPGFRRAKDLLLEGAAFSIVVAPALGATALSRASEGFTPGRSCKMHASYTPPRSGGRSTTVEVFQKRFDGTVGRNNCRLGPAQDSQAQATRLTLTLYGLMAI